MESSDPIFFVDGFPVYIHIYNYLFNVIFPKGIIQDSYHERKKVHGMWDKEQQFENDSPWIRWYLIFNYGNNNLFSIQMTTCKGGVGCTLQDHWHQMNIHVQLSSIKFIVSVNIYLLICPWGSILKVKPCNVGRSILDFQPPWKTNIKGTMQPSLLSNGSVVSDKNNFKIYFPQGNTQVKFVLQWLPSWISKQHKNWKHCKRPSNDYSCTVSVQYI